ncbi:unnamed protein product [Clavelina lepadiformis]|uniref:Uncharacterized protein n=1 Tax=Clavelina lepadiformis TaxID=159417 RepID=A0ABP0FPJ2_CLALP
MEELFRLSGYATREMTTGISVSLLLSFKKNVSYKYNYWHLFNFSIQKMKENDKSTNEDQGEDHEDEEIKTASCSILSVVEEEADIELLCEIDFEQILDLYTMDESESSKSDSEDSWTCMDPELEHEDDDQKEEDANIAGTSVFPKEEELEVLFEKELNQILDLPLSIHTMEDFESSISLLEEDVYMDLELEHEDNYEKDEEDNNATNSFLSDKEKLKILFQPVLDQLKTLEIFNSNTEDSQFCINLPEASNTEPAWQEEPQEVSTVSQELLPFLEKHKVLFRQVLNELHVVDWASDQRLLQAAEPSIDLSDISDDDFLYEWQLVFSSSSLSEISSDDTYGEDDSENWTSDSSMWSLADLTERISIPGWCYFFLIK